MWALSTVGKLNRLCETCSCTSVTCMWMFRSEIKHRRIFKTKVSQSCSVMSDSLQPHGLSSPWNSPGQNTGVWSLSLLQGIFPTQGSNLGFLHCRQILYSLSHQICMYNIKGLCSIVLILISIPSSLRYW